jgi:hypothetical protein
MQAPAVTAAGPLETNWPGPCAELSFGVCPRESGARRVMMRREQRPVRGELRLDEPSCDWRSRRRRDRSIRVGASRRGSAGFRWRSAESKTGDEIAAAIRDRG